MDRLTKQIVIAAIFFLLVGGSSYGIYEIFNVNPTCFDGIRNQGEEGIDCGLVCGKLCDPGILPLSVGTPELVSVNGAGYDLIVKINNPNSVYGSGDVSYFISIMDGEKEVSRQSGKTYVLPAQSMYVIITLPEISGSPDKAEFVIRNVEWQKIDIADAPQANFTLQREDFTDGTQTDLGVVSSMLEGVLRNGTAFDFAVVDVHAILYDDRNRIIGVGSTDIRSFLSGEDRFFKMTWPQVFNTVPRIVVVGTTNIFENTNYIRKYGTSERFQKYYEER